MKTTVWKNHTLTVFDSVYEPREDSFLLAEALDKADLSDQEIGLEIGCGSGFQSIVLALKGLSMLAVDINPDALENTQLNAEKLGLNIQVEESDLFEQVQGRFDLIVFNPPYVLSEAIKDKSVDGGEKGRMLLDRFLMALPNHLSDGGECFFLQSNLNDIEETSKLLEEIDFGFEIVARKKLFFEELLVFRCWAK
jgi:release factor glutamine methyltransferase